VDTPPTGWQERVLDTSPDVVVLMRRDGTIVHMSASARRLGFDPDVLVGTNGLDLVHPDDVERAVETLFFAQDNPAYWALFPIRLINADDRVVPLDVLAVSQFDDPAVGAATLYCRDASERELADEILDAIAGGAELPEIVALLIRMFDKPTWPIRCAIRYAGTDGQVAVAHDGLPPALTGALPSPGSPWEVALRTRQPVVVTAVDDLPAALRHEVADHGFAACWAYPVEDGNFAHDCCLIVWNGDPYTPAMGQRLVLERVLRLLQLAMQRRDHLAYLEHAAHHDVLTQLANRAQFAERLQAAFVEDAGSSTTGSHSVAVLYIDVDGFKAVNDRLGHAAGDRLLRELAARLRDAAGPGALVARLGGDEFAVLITADAVVDVATASADRIIGRVREPGLVRDEDLAVTVSIGIAHGPPSARPEQLVEAADAALYRAKAGGKNRWTVSDVSGSIV